MTSILENTVRYHHLVCFQIHLAHITNHPMIQPFITHLISQVSFNNFHSWEGSAFTSAMKLSSCGAWVVSWSEAEGGGWGGTWVVSWNIESEKIFSIETNQRAGPKGPGAGLLEGRGRRRRARASWSWSLEGRDGRSGTLQWCGLHPAPAGCRGQDGMGA